MTDKALTDADETVFVVLLVDDDLADAGLAKRALKRGPMACVVHHVRDGVEAMEFLRREGEGFRDAPRPDLILLDLNMPRKDGRETLAEIKADSGLKSIPVVMLTTSDVVRDVEASYLQGANSYLTKPLDVVDFFTMIHAVQHYWFTVVKLPK